MVQALYEDNLAVADQLVGSLACDALFELDYIAVTAGCKSLWRAVMPLGLSLLLTATLRPAWPHSDADKNRPENARIAFVPDITRI